MNNRTTTKLLPLSKPPFTLADIKRAVPPHCFKRSLVKSFAYLAYDITVITILYHIANTYFYLLPKPLSYVAWPVYWAAQSCFFVAVWMVGHDCGHHSFSDYQWVDDTVGFVVHSFLLTPYFSWKHTHRSHHANNGSLERDESFVPKTKDEVRWHFKYLDHLPGRIFYVFFTLTLGWPLYLMFNITGRPYKDGFASHFYPMSPMYEDHERFGVVLSDMGMLAMWFTLYKLSVAFGVTWVLCVYFIPLVLQNALFVTITYLHHTHPNVPRYDSSGWGWMRGSLVTVDRDYGFLNKVFHNVTDTHVAHHLFTHMPHYHQLEATKAFIPILGEYYQADPTPFYKALWREMKHCVYVEQDKDANVDQNKRGVYWYKTKS
uniref:Omega-6 desaturase n=1 Tax=Linum usitatissimum TaxID=4006 RepID=I6Y9I9_LINUS|nr:omega-6 desaturase [Linum usitatissimum]